MASAWRAGDARIEEWQQAHGRLPPALLHFLASDARWDTRLAAWLLYVQQNHVALRAPVWARFVQSLPAVEDLHLLCLFTPEEQRALQVPWCGSLAIAYLRKCNSQTPRCGGLLNGQQMTWRTHITCGVIASLVYCQDCQAQLAHIVHTAAWQ